MWFFSVLERVRRPRNRGRLGDGAGGKILQENLTLLSTLTHLNSAKQSQSGSLSRQRKF